MNQEVQHSAAQMEHKGLTNTTIHANQPEGLNFAHVM